MNEKDIKNEQNTIHENENASVIRENLAMGHENSTRARTREDAIRELSLLDKTFFHIQNRRSALKDQIRREKSVSPDENTELVEKNGLLLFRSVEIENWENALEYEREAALASHCF